MADEIDEAEGVEDWRFTMRSMITPTGEHILKFQTPDSAPITELVGALLRAAISYTLDTNDELEEDE